MHSRHRHIAIAQQAAALSAAHLLAWAAKPDWAAFGLPPLLGLAIRCLWP